MTNPGKECYLGRMRGLVRLACLVLPCLVLLGAGGLSLGPASAQTVPPPQRPFSQLVDLWTRQLDRIAYRTDQPDILPAEIDALREQASDVRTAAAAAAALARNDLADTKKLLAPLEVKPGTDQPPETDAVKAERERLTEQATISESRVKQCEVIIARADQLLERMTKLRGEVVMQTLLHATSRRSRRRSGAGWCPSSSAAVQTICAAVVGLEPRRPAERSASGDQDLTPLAWWAAATIVLWWGVLTLRRRYGRGERRRRPASTTAPSPPRSTASGWCWCRSWRCG